MKLLSFSSSFVTGARSMFICMLIGACGCCCKIIGYLSEMFWLLACLEVGFEDSSLSSPWPRCDWFDPASCSLPNWISYFDLILLWSSCSDVCDSDFLLLSDCCWLQKSYWFRLSTSTWVNRRDCWYWWLSCLLPKESTSGAPWLCEWWFSWFICVWRPSSSSYCCWYFCCSCKWLTRYASISRSLSLIFCLYFALSFYTVDSICISRLRRKLLCFSISCSFWFFSVKAFYRHSTYSSRAWILESLISLSFWCRINDSWSSLFYCTNSLYWLVLYSKFCCRLSFCPLIIFLCSTSSSISCSMCSF